MVKKKSKSVEYSGWCCGYGSGSFWGWFFLLLGIWYLAKGLGWIAFNISIWPVFLIILGVHLLRRKKVC